jgi:hypothetical protein
VFDDNLFSQQNKENNDQELHRTAQPTPNAPVHNIPPNPLDLASRDLLPAAAYVGVARSWGQGWP